MQINVCIGINLELFFSIKYTLGKIVYVLSFYPNHIQYFYLTTTILHHEQTSGDPNNPEVLK